ncbi:alpha-soluble NSF attachment protein [Striga asiatica]|uniref:Alpha-soluble NSF attachment protein n=1 Tax=Striga asiatica TaxID=4170 RepID=A0A5A7Q5E8_STRAF|nr:alpha-soluble NSF attachment protein [Striga asiatica]
MGDQIARGEEFEKKAEKKLNGWGLFGSKHEDAAELFDKAANAFKLAKSWDQAGAVYIKLANCHLKLDSKHEAANAYADAAHCYKKTNIKESISCLEQAVNLFLDIGRLTMAARYYKKMTAGLNTAAITAILHWLHKFLMVEIAELCEQDQNLEQSIVYYERAADLFQNEEVTSTANQCKQKVAQFAAQLEHQNRILFAAVYPLLIAAMSLYLQPEYSDLCGCTYPKAIEIYEEIARHSLNNNLLKYGVKGHLLNAGLCQLCRGDVVAITNALEKYQELDPTFSGTREYKLLADLAAAVDEEDVAKFTAAVKEFDSMTQLDAWRTTLLLRVKEALKAKELEEDDLT